jgi:hypothetical protein
MADSVNNRVVRVSSGGAASVLATSGVTTLNAPQAVGVDAMGNTYIADTGNRRIVQVGSTGTASVIDTSGLPSPSTEINPVGVTVDTSGNIFVADAVNNRVIEAPVSSAIVPVTPTIVWSPPLGVAYGTTLSGVLTAAAEINNNAPVTGTFVYTATPSGGSATTITNATILAVGTYTLTATFTPTDTIDFTSATATVNFTVTKGTAVISLTSSINPVLLGNPATFNVIVSSPGVTPTGTVTFSATAGPTYNQQFQPSTLSATGTASVGITFETALTYTITVIYSGDSNYNGGQSTVTETVEDFNLSFVSTPGVASPVLFPGGSAAYALQISPLSGSVFPSAVTFSISGLPAGASATFSPQSLAASSPGTTVTLTITLANKIVSHIPAFPFGRGLTLAMMGGMFLLPFATRVRRRPGKTARVVGTLLLLLAATCAALGLAACGGSNGGKGYFGQQVQNYTVTVTATSGALSHTATVNLTVQ